MKELPFKIKKIIKAHRRMDRKPTARESRAEVENLIRRRKNGTLDDFDQRLASELEGIAPLAELSKLLQY